MSLIIETIAFVFGLIGLGYVSGRTGFLGSRVGESLTQFAVAIAIPALLFRTVVEADFAGIRPWALWIAYFSAVTLSWAIGQIVVTRAFGRDAQAAIVGGVASSFSNMVLLGLPLVLGIYGRQGFEVLSVLVMVHLPIMMAASIMLFAWADRHSSAASSAKALVVRFLRTLFGNPLIIGIIAGILWRMTGWRIHSPIDRIVDALAGVAGPVALFSIGLGLVQFGIRGSVAPALALLMVKLFVMPATVLLLVIALDLPPLSAQVAVVAAALPTGINPYLIAVRFQNGQALASNMMTMTTAVAVLTMAFWLAVVQAVFG